jgi:hypothetical protein
LAYERNTVLWAGSSSKSDGACAREDTPPERLTPFDNNTSRLSFFAHRRIGTVIIDKLSSVLATIFQAGHGFKLVTVSSWSRFKLVTVLKLVTVHEVVLDCLPTLIQLFA